MSNTENTETQNVSEEQLLEQQFNDLLLELSQDTQDKFYFVKKNVTFSQKKTFFLHRVRVIFGYYINNIHTTNN